MARQSLLTISQCEKIRAERKAGVPAVKLAKRYKVSESSLYKVLDGSYVARPDATKPAVVAAAPVVAAVPEQRRTQSIFESGQPRAQHTNLHPVLAQLMDKAQEIDDVEIDDVTLAAAELVVAKARLDRALAHAH